MELADDLMAGHIAKGDLGRAGLRRFKCMWFNPASGQFVADAGGCFMWAETVDGPWRIVPNTAPCCKGVHSGGWNGKSQGS